jgi:hypothetical protein
LILQASGQVAASVRIMALLCLRQQCRGFFDKASHGGSMGSWSEVIDSLSESVQQMVHLR